MLLALCWMVMLSAFGQTNWRLDQVHCHEVGAQLQFVTPIQATGGGLVVELANLPADVDVSGVQVELPEGLTLISVDHGVQEVGPSDRMLELEKELRDSELALALEQALLASLRQERTFLECNRTIAGGNEVLLVDDLDEMRHFIAQRHRELALEEVELNAAIAEMQEVHGNLQREYDALSWESKVTRPALNLVLSGTGRGNLVVRVTTEMAGWVSSYDVSWDEGEEALQVERFAKVIQTTGMDWNNVLIHFRTGQPMSEVTATRPAPRPALVQSSARNAASQYCASYEWVNSGLRNESARQEVLGGHGAFASNWSMTGAKRVDVNGHGNASRIYLDRQQLEGQPRWVASSEESDKASRSCETTDWMKHEMLSGEGRVFRNNAMVGAVPLNMPSWGDSLVVQLGQDREVHVKRSLLQDKSGTRKWSGKRVVEQVRQVEVTNDKSYGVLVDVFEAIPESGAIQLEVDVTDGGVWNREEGRVEWPERLIAPGETWTSTLRMRLILPPGVQVDNF